MNFKDWLLKEAQEGAKTGLYPLGYGGIGLYPPQWYLTRSADAIFYLSLDDRIYKGKDHPRLKKLPEPSEKKLDSGEGPLWDISHLDGKPSHPVGKDYAAKAGEKGIWNIAHLKGGKEKPAANKDHAANVGEKGTWDISGIPK